MKDLDDVILFCENSFDLAIFPDSKAPSGLLMAFYYFSYCLF